MGEWNLSVSKNVLCIEGPFRVTKNESGTNFTVDKTKDSKTHRKLI